MVRFTEVTLPCTCAQTSSCFYSSRYCLLVHLFLSLTHTLSPLSLSLSRLTLSRALSNLACQHASGTFPSRTRRRSCVHVQRNEQDGELPLKLQVSFCSPRERSCSCVPASVLACVYASVLACVHSSSLCLSPPLSLFILWGRDYGRRQPGEDWCD
jgi:hypothetical protein